MDELERIYEAAISEGRKDAIKKVSLAAELLKDAEELLKDAADLVKDTPDCYRIGSVADEVGFLRKDTEKLEERVKKSA